MKVYLNVEHGCRIDWDSGVLLQDLGQLHLVVGLDLHELTLERGVGGERLQLSQLVQMNGPALTF